ncbi:MAG: hypothetical protein ACOVQA_07595 [Thermoflexibacteraceae bacterium]
MDNQENTKSSTSHCQLTKGIFVQRACGAKAFVVCGVCRRSVCNEHIDKSSSSRVICVECIAQEYYQTEKTYTTSRKTSAPRLSKTYDDFWYYTTRYHFTDVYHYQAFNHRDYEAFDKTIDNVFTDNTSFDEDTNSFLDS